MKLFGPKAHERFPRKYREPGSGACASGGFYPTDSAGHYEEQGVDLEISPGTMVNISCWCWSYLLSLGHMHSHNKTPKRAKVPIQAL